MDNVTLIVIGSVFLIVVSGITGLVLVAVLVRYFLRRRRGRWVARLEKVTPLSTPVPPLAGSVAQVPGHTTLVPSSLDDKVQLGQAVVTRRLVVIPPQDTEAEDDSDTATELYGRTFDPALEELNAGEWGDRTPDPAVRQKRPEWLTGVHNGGKSDKKKPGP